jgi:hypothetical protein
MKRIKGKNSMENDFFNVDPIYIIGFFTLLLYISIYVSFVSFSNRLNISNSIVEFPAIYILRGPTELFGLLFFVILFSALLWGFKQFIILLLKYILPFNWIKFLNIRSKNVYSVIANTFFLLLGLCILFFEPLSLSLPVPFEEYNSFDVIAGLMILIAIFDWPKEEMKRVAHEVDREIKPALHLKYIIFFVIFFVSIFAVASLSDHIGKHYADDIKNKEEDITIYLNSNESFNGLKFKFVMHYDNNYYLLNKSKYEIYNLIIIPDTEVRIAFLGATPPGV